MKAAIDRKIVIVRRATRLEGLRVRYATAGQAKFMLKRSAALESVRRGRAADADAGSADFDDAEREDADYAATLGHLRERLAGLLPVQVLDRELLPTYLFGPSDIVVTVGQDGLVANAAKYTVGLPVVAVNPDPARFDGVLLPFRPDDAYDAVRAAAAGRAAVRRVTLGRVLLNDGQSLLAFNDFFVGAASHVSARYRIEFDGHAEAHSSSGVIVSTGAGSTGWLSSVFNMAGGLGPLDGQPRSRASAPRLAWDDPRLAFVVREPFVSRTSSATLVSGIVGPKQELILHSMMPRGGVVFSDGVEADRLEFAAGTIARIAAAAEQATLVVKS